MRWGFGQAQGPFEIWQSAGWATVARWVQDDIDAGKALCAAPLPDWVFNGPVADGGGVHQAQGSWSAAQSRFVPPSTLPVYARQHFRESVFGSGAPLPLASGTEVFKTDELRVWTLDGEVLIASITAKLHLISPAVTEGLMRAVALAEESYQGLVVWSPDDVFSAGANLEALMPVFMKSGAKGVEPEERKLQELMLRVRYASVPVVCAIRGMALGGGCELAVHSARRVAAMESYVGLVEMGVGLLPGAGGLTYIARRAAAMAAAGNANADLLTFLKDGFTSVAMAKVGTSAIEGRKLGYLLDADVIVPHKDELLFVAITQAKAIFNSGYQPPVKSLFPVAGRSAAATLKTQLVNMRDGGFITAHDFHIASLIAEVLCGGDVDAGSLVSEDYLMALERKHFCALLEHPKTQERIMGMLSTGKPVRN
jgi:3-hydroxyacyl-CoA dehydrogenase